MSNGPELPVIYENPRFDKATPTLWPVFDRATRFTLVILMEWGTLTLIEESPRYVKFATVVVAALGLAVHESWPWLRMRDWRWYPSLMITLIASYIGIFVYAVFTEPPHRPQIAVAAPPALPPPQEPSGAPIQRPVAIPSRPKQAITELLAESGGLIDIVQKTLVPLENEWRNSLGGQNPERICLGLNSLSLQEKATNLTERLKASDKDVLQILEQNRIDRTELAPLVGYPADAGEPDDTFATTAARHLENYRELIRKIGPNPTCNEVVQSDLSRGFYEMTGILNAFQGAVNRAQDRLGKYRDALRKEARNAP